MRCNRIFLIILVLAFATNGICQKVIDYTEQIKRDKICIENLVNLYQKINSGNFDSTEVAKFMRLFPANQEDYYRLFISSFHDNLRKEHNNYIELLIKLRQKYPVQIRKFFIQFFRKPQELEDCSEMVEKFYLLIEENPKYFCNYLDTCGVESRNNLLNSISNPNERNIYMIIKKYCKPKIFLEYKKMVDTFWDRF